MKRYFSGLITGVVLTLLLGSLAIGALAISSQMTITVDPINIQINGETFVPKDVNGAEVPVFAYNGTTYAPLRALAEAYDLEVGYDAATNMATVTDPDAKPATTPAPDTTANVPDYSGWSAEDEAAYQEFKGMWEYTDECRWDHPTAKYIGEKTRDKLIAFLKEYGEDTFDKFSIRMGWEAVTPDGMMILVYEVDDTFPLIGIYGSTTEEYKDKVCDIVFHDGYIPG